MEDNFRAWQAALAEYQIKLQPEDYYPLEGLAVRELPRKLFGKYGLEPPNEREVVQKKEAHYLAHHHFELYPGAWEFIEELGAKHIPLALVTAALRNRLNQSLPSGFLEKFDVVVTGEDTSEGKPSSAPYLKAAEQLRIPPQACMVIENAPLGIESAKRAGMHCIAVCSTLDKTHLGAADEIVDSLSDLKRSVKIRDLLQSSL